MQCANIFSFIEVNFSILRRLPQAIPGHKPILHEIQPDLHPLEVLYDVSKLLDEKNVKFWIMEKVILISLSGPTFDCSLHQNISSGRPL